MIPPSILECLTSEAQAIGIYEAECLLIRFLPKMSKGIQLERLLRTVLEEEKGHLYHLQDQFPHLSIRYKLLIKLNRIIGWCIGSVLSPLPAHWIARVHIMGESTAAEIYRNAQAKIGSVNLTLIKELQQSTIQEEKHVKIFKDFRSAYS